jgi:5-methylcytosine-specific restriction enzyme subunit McrC
VAVSWQVVPSSSRASQTACKSTCGELSRGEEEHGPHFSDGPSSREGLITLARAAAERLGRSEIKLERSSFSRVRLHRNNAYYDLLLKVAELAFDCLLPDPAGSGFLFQDVLRDEIKMARVFEEFVRNFYRTEQQTFSVEPLTIQWHAVSLETSGLGRLPAMRTDVFLSNAKRQIIIDTKYYASALQIYHGNQSFHSGNLYQLFSYLKNFPAGTSTSHAAEGMLLYPEVQHELDSLYEIQGHRVKIATVDLSKPWPMIEHRLLALLTATAPDGPVRITN